MEAVSDFNQNYTQVFGHCHSHFLKVFSLCFGAAAECNLIEFTDTIYEICHGIPKLGLYRGLCDTGVFDYVMQHGGHKRLMVHVHLDKYTGDCQRMCHIGLTAMPELTLMSLFGEVVCPSYAIDLVNL
tara:strand:- start:1282 stop:1665 length:384 start_codon:yes stop_codon:yes gene_type:complete